MTFGPLLLLLTLTASTPPEQPPNVLWISCEDLSPHFGFMGDPQARTPVLDALAARSTVYTQAFATSGVCAPARSCLITGRYPSSLGSQFMRCQSRLPEGLRFFTHHLRDAGYHCTNRSKKDYNLVEPPGAWDESSGKASWRSRPEGRPFFSVVNFTLSHESKIRQAEAAFQKATRKLGEDQRHDPAEVELPPFYPDTPIVRRDLARLHDLISALDHEVAGILRQLEEDGLAEDTVVFFFSDHGDGLPRCKRWIYDSGIHVPLIVHVPEKYRAWAGAPGPRTDRLVSFVDFGPTVLSLCGVDVPDSMQGRPFLGPQAAEPRSFVYALRDRMDERDDHIRGVRDGRYKYLRNYRPELPRAQRLEYMEQMPTMKELRRLAAAGELRGAEDFFMRPGKPSEELYDLEADPHEVDDRAGDPELAAVLARMRAELDSWERRTLDLGAFPEARLRELCRDTTPWEFARAHPELVERVRQAARSASGPDPDLDLLRRMLEDDEPAVRVWALRGLRGLPEDRREEFQDVVARQMEQADPSLRLAAAERLADWGDVFGAFTVLGSELSSPDEWVRLRAAIALDHCDEQARFLAGLMKSRLDDPNGYVVRVLKQALRELGETW